MIAGELPFTAMSQEELFNKIKVGTYALPAGINISECCRDMISRLIQENPERRMNYAQFREHPFVQLEPEAYKMFLDKLQHSIRVPPPQSLDGSIQQANAL